jgi:NADH:ubiquinone oxidoreductase subunit H
VIGLVTAILAAWLVPLGARGSLASFPGDLIAFAYLLALGRFFTIAAALDTGSAFEGMGAAREAAYSCLAEPAAFFALLGSGAQAHGPRCPGCVGAPAGLDLSLVVLSPRTPHPLPRPAHHGPGPVLDPATTSR